MKTARDFFDHQYADQLKEAGPDNPYALVHEWWGAVEYRFAARVLNNAGVQRCHTIFLACCGSGAGLGFWTRRLQAELVYALDFSHQGVLAARRQAMYLGLDRCFFSVEGDARNLPFRTDSIDVSLCFHSLHHLPDPNRAVAEMVRVSRVACVIIEPLWTLLTPILEGLGIQATVEEDGARVRRFRGQDFAPFGRVWEHRYLHKYIPAFYTHVLPRFNSNKGIMFLSLVYYPASAILRPLHTKAAWVIRKHE